MNTKLQDKSKDVCCGQALLGRASTSFSLCHWHGLLSKRTVKNALFPGETSFSRTLIWRNEPNFNTSNIIATSYITVVYNDSFQNSTKKTNPIKANFFTTSKPHFSAELFSDTRLPQGLPTGCKNGDWLVPAEGRVVPVPFFATAVKRSNRSKEPQKRKKTLKVKTKT